MGLIMAAIDAISGTLSDQWLEVIEPDDMGDQIVFTQGALVHRNSGRVSNTSRMDIISDGSIIHVYPNQCMLLVDGGKVVDFTTDPGYYRVDNSETSSFFNTVNKSFDSAMDGLVREIFDRIKFSGVPSKSQKVFYINLQEIKGIKFGTKQPINYFDNFYNAELFLRAHGVYSIKIKNPLLFYSEVIPKNATRVEIEDINEQYFSEFMEALQSAINQLSADGERISFVASKGTKLSKYMADVLDESWLEKRGMEILSVGLASISYDEVSQGLIAMRNQGAMLSDPTVREGYLQGAVARGLEEGLVQGGGSGGLGHTLGFGVSVSPVGDVMKAASATNLEQLKMMQNQSGRADNGNLELPTQPTSIETWQCNCGTANQGNFCTQCGSPKKIVKFCTQCGAVLQENSKFCSACGKAVEA